jgi:uncharacterized membrane protein
MKSNEIIAEGPLDYIKNTAKNLGQAVQSGGIQGFKQNQAVDRRNSNYEARLQRNVKIVARKWDSKERSMPNRAALHNDPQAYYGELLKFLDKEIKAGQTGNLAIPDIINPKNTNDIITKFSQKAFPPTRLPGEAPTATTTAATEPAVTTPSEPTAPAGKTLPDWARGTFRDPATKLAPGINRVPKARTSTAAPAPATAAPAAPTAAATSTLPTKVKSKIRSKDIDIDAALKMADTLSPEEKKKLLQDLLKSGVPVKAGGA